MSREPRILALDGAWDLHVAFGLVERRIHSRRVDELTRFNAFSFDIIILQSHADVTKLGNKVTRFLDDFRERGGSLILFAPAQNCQPTSGVHFEINRLSKLKPVPGEIKQKLIPNLVDPRELRFHDKFICHGVFVPAAPDQCALATTDEQQGVLGVIKGTATRGDLIISTIDFDYHGLHGPTVAVDAKPDEIPFPDRAVAKEMCRTIVDFAVERWQDRMKSKSIFTRRLRALAAPQYLPILGYALSGIAMALILPRLSKDAGNLLVYVILGIITVVKGVQTAWPRDRGAS
jgi:hypothetical protein